MKEFSAFEDRPVRFAMTRVVDRRHNAFLRIVIFVQPFIDRMVGRAIIFQLLCGDGDALADRKTAGRLGTGMAIKVDLHCLLTLLEEKRLVEAFWTDVEAVNFAFDRFHNPYNPGGGAFGAGAAAPAGEAEALADLLFQDPLAVVTGHWDPLEVGHPPVPQDLLEVAALVRAPS